MLRTSEPSTDGERLRFREPLKHMSNGEDFPAAIKITGKEQRNMRFLSTDNNFYKTNSLGTKRRKYVAANELRKNKIQFKIPDVAIQLVFKVEDKTRGCQPGTGGIRRKKHNQSVNLYGLEYKKSLT